MAAEGSESPFEVPSPLLNTSTVLAGSASISSGAPPLPLQAPADVLSPDQLSFLFFTGNQFEEHAAAAAAQVDQPTTSSGKKRGRKLAPATGDKRREANRAAQRSFRERKVQHVRDLEIRVAAFEIQQARATQTIHSLLQDNARLRHSAGERAQTVSELVDSGSTVEPRPIRRPSLSTSSSFHSVVTSPTRSPGSLPDSLSEPTSPVVDASGLPASHGPLHHGYPTSAASTGSDPPSSTFGMPTLPIMQQDFYSMGGSCRPPPLPSLHSQMPASHLGNYGHDFGHHDPNFWPPAMLQNLSRGVNNHGARGQPSRSATPVQGSTYHQPSSGSVSAMHQHHLSSSTLPQDHMSGSALGFHPEHHIPYFSAHTWGPPSQDR